MKTSPPIGSALREVLVMGSLRFYFRRTMACLFKPYGYFMRLWGLGEVLVTGIMRPFYVVYCQGGIIKQTAA
jgi:hypothetical protein